MDRINNAVEKLNQGYACPQAILTAYCDLFNMDQQTALKLSAGFGGGMRNGKTCGAVTGAFMVLGLKFGNQTCNEADGRKNVNDAVVEFTKSFEQLYGSTDCKELLGCNVGTADGLQKAKEENLFNTVCPKFIKSAAEILETMLNKK